MKLASFTVIAQHPKAFSKHIRNLRWATNNSISEEYIFTNKQWGLTSDRPSLKIVEVGGSPFRYYPFWALEAERAFRQLDVDALIISEGDVIYHDNIMSYVEKAINDNVIVMDNDVYDGFRIQKDNQTVYPRLWEGGLILPRKFIEDANAHNIKLFKQVKNKFLIDWMKPYTGHYVYRHPIRFELDHLERYPDWYFDTMIELTLFAFCKQYPVLHACIVSHLPYPEAVHRMYPKIYNGIFDEQVLDKMAEVIKGIKSYNSHLSTSLMDFYLTGVLNEVSPVTEKRWKNSIVGARDKVSRICRHAHEWMTADELSRLKVIDKLCVAPIIPGIKLL